MHGRRSRRRRRSSESTAKATTKATAFGRIYNILVGRDDSKGRSSNKSLLLESKRWEGDKEGQGSKERENNGSRKKNQHCKGRSASCLSLEVSAISLALVR